MNNQSSRDAPDSGELLDFLMEHIPDVIFFKDVEGRFIRVNHAFLETFALESPEDVIGKSDADFLDPEDALRTARDERELVQSGQGIVGAVSRKHHPDGSQWWALTTKLPLKNSAGEIIGTCGISKDITGLKEAEADLSQANAQLERAVVEIKRAQAQLIDAEKARSVSRLAEGLAHEVRNPLAVLSMGLDFIAPQPSMQADDACQAVIADMREAMKRADRVINTLLQASRPAGLDLHCVDVRELVEDAYSSFSHKGGSANVSVVREWSSDTLMVKADRAQLSHVIEGLLANAYDAMKAGGELTLRTRIESRNDVRVLRDAGSRCGQVFHGAKEIVCLDIQDSGDGISDEVKSRIFDAFFTTKDTGSTQGLGLGLTSCRAILELHGGLLEVNNRKDASGVIATIRLARIE
ncbi:MAG: two-component system sensor histidine kinase NtrB [Opitutaceae bacterium]